MEHFAKHMGEGYLVMLHKKKKKILYDTVGFALTRHLINIISDLFPEADPFNPFTSCEIFAKFTGS